MTSIRSLGGGGGGGGGGGERTPTVTNGSPSSKATSGSRFGRGAAKNKWGTLKSFVGGAVASKKQKQMMLEQQRLQEEAAEAEAMTPEEAEAAEALRVAKIQESSLSAPTAVQHTAHVGVNSDGTLDLTALPPEWKILLTQASDDDATRRRR